MNAYPSAFSPFAHIRILAESKRDAYEANGHEYLVGAEPQHQIKMRSRQIAAGAVRVVRERRPGASSIQEAGVVRVVEIIAASVVRGTGHPEPFSEDSVRTLHDLFANDRAEGDAWEVALLALAQAAEKELDFETFVLFDLWHQRLFGVYHGARIAHACLRHGAEIAQRAANRILQFCPPQDGAWDEPARAAAAALLDDFYRELARAYQFGNASALHLFLARYAAERLAVRWEASVPEWLFIFSTLEHELATHLRPTESRSLARDFLGLQRLAESLTFCGRLHRSAVEIEKAITPAAQKLGVEPSFLLQATVAGYLLNAGAWEIERAPLLAWSLLSGQSRLSRAEPQALREAARAMRDAALRHAERHWVDHLEAELLRLAQAAAWRHTRRQHAAWIEQLAQRLSQNVAEAIEAVRASPRFVPDLLALLDQASLAGIFFANPRHASAWLRNWFSVNIGISQVAHAWRAPRPIIKGLQTLIQQGDPDEPLYAATAEAVERLAPLESWLEACAEASCGWPHATAHALDLDRHISDPTCQRDSLWLLRAALLASLRTDPEGVRQHLTDYVTWAVIPYAGKHALPVYLATYRALNRAVEAHSDLGNTAAAQALAQFTAACEPPVLSVLLWHHAHDIAQSAAQTIYEELPEYRERAGSDSQTLCVRDCGLILRRASLAVAEGSGDPVDFIARWWENVVNAYLVSRTPHLFQVQVRALAKAADDLLGPPAGAQLKLLIEPVLTGGTAEDALPTRMRFRPRPHLPASLPSREDPTLATWLHEKRSEDWHYAATHPLPDASEPAEDLRHSLDELILGAWSSWLLAGTLPPDSVAAAARHLRGQPGASASWERALVHAIYRSADGPPALAPALAGYLQSWILQARSFRAADWLEEHGEDLAGAVIDHAHRAFPSLTADGVSAPDPDKCRRDFTLLLRSLAAELRREEPAAVPLQAHRYVLQLIEPYAGYGPALWSMMWQASRLLLPAWEDQPARAVLDRLFGSLAATTQHMGWIKPLAGRINSADTPVFSPDETEEAAWRDATNLVLASCLLAGNQPANPQSAGLASWRLPVPAAEAREKLPRVANAFGEWFLDLDLEPLRRQVALVVAHLEAREKWEHLVNELPGLAERFSGLGALGDAQTCAMILALSAAEAAGAASHDHSPWAISWRDRAAAALGESAGGWQTSGPKLRVAATNLLGPRMGSTEAAGAAMESLLQHLEQRGAFNSLWRDLPTAPDLTEPCSRDGSWFARRVMAAALNGQGADGCYRWLAEEVLPFAGTEQTPKDIERMVRAEITVLRSFPDRIKGLEPLLDQLEQTLAAFLAGRYLLAKRMTLAEQAVASAFSGHGPDPARCTRDTALVLLAVAEHLDGGKESNPPALWFDRSVRPFLTQETAAHIQTLHGEVARHVAADLPDDSAAEIRRILESLTALSA